MLNVIELSRSYQKYSCGGISMVAPKKGGGKLSRSEIVTVRLDPKLRFAAELAARKQRRTLSSFVEWAIEQAVREVTVLNKDDIRGNAWQAMMRVWDVDEADRLVKLAINFPELLTYDEERLWKLISEQPYFWYRDWDRDGIYRLEEDWVNFNHLREQWETLNLIIEGEANISDLPEGENSPYAPPKEINEEDIPF